MEEVRSERPNVIFILSDQHNAKVLSHKGHPDVRTPNLDRMAAEGVRFDKAITQNPICTPSRVSWLSGQYCHNHGYYGLCGPNPKGLPTVMGHFKEAGYRTAAIGKIHCPEYWVEDDSDLFREVINTSIGGNPEYRAYLKSKGLFELEDAIGLKEFGDQGRQVLDGRKSNLAYEDSPEGWSVREGIRFMEKSLEQDRPFFVHISFPKPHQCYTPSEPFWSMYGQGHLTLPPNADYDRHLKSPDLIRQAEEHRQGAWALFEPKTFEAARLRKLQGYLGNVSHVDHSVGELLDWLDDQGLSENTIVVYSSDHGDYACEHGIMEKAPGICSDAITRIPFIWRWKGHFKSGHKADEVVETVDLANTLCRLSGIEPMLTADGKDISHLLNGESGEVRDIGVTEFAWSRSIRKGDFRLVYYPVEMFKDSYPGGFGELYDLSVDPWEMTNLYFDPVHQDKVRELKEAYLDFLIITTRPGTAHHCSRLEGDQYRERYHHQLNRDDKIHPDVIRSAKVRNYL